jgi:HD-GYP domain-containing protein (c-di-GMP phosphodiesterase class II)
MTDDPSQHFATVDELRLGMFVHLEGGWLAHPFPLSNFKLTSPQQIATIRSLRLKRVRWSPSKSDLEASTGSFDALLATSGASGSGSATVGAQAGGSAPGAATAMLEALIAEPEPPELAAERQRRLALAEQREAVQHCQRQFAEAADVCKKVTDLIKSEPQEARAQSEALSRAFVDKMLAHEEVCIRLLGEVSGEKASMHAINVTVLSLLLGKTFGLGEADMQDLGVGAVLHDMGKQDIPERLRHRDDHHSASELLVYQEHVAHGVATARRMGLSDGARHVVEQHHEHVDGSGFPLRVGGDRMTLAARIVALVNRYDNLCNPHIPSRALTPHEALSLLFAQGKAKFDTTILASFVKMMGVYPPGSAVQLTDERYALVVSVNSSRPLKPRVLVHDPRVCADEALLLDLEREAQLGIRRSVKPLALPREALDYLSPRPRMAYFFEPSRESVPEAAG